MNAPNLKKPGPLQVANEDGAVHGADANDYVLIAACIHAAATTATSHNDSLESIVSRSREIFKAAHAKPWSPK